MFNKRFGIFPVPVSDAKKRPTRRHREVQTDKPFDKPPKPKPNGGTASRVSTDQHLRERLEAAEAVCLMYGWSTGSEECDRDKALYMLWTRWLRLAEADDPEYSTPKRHPELSDEIVARLAAERDEIRARTLAKIESLMGRVADHA